MKKRSLIISLILIGALLGLGPWGPTAQPSWAQAQAPAPAQAQAPTYLAPDTFAKLAKEVSGAVVNISTEKVVKNQMQEYFGQGQPQAGTETRTAIWTGRSLRARRAVPGFPGFL